MDDHSVVREAIQRLAREAPDLQVAGAAASVSEAIRQGPDADVCLLDLGLVARDGDAIHRFRDAFPETRLVLLTDGEPDEVVRSALRAGAVAVVAKSWPVPQLLDVVRRAATGGSLDRALPAHGDSPLRRLTPRERDVLTLLVEGRTNRDAAAVLGISPRTVSSHIASIYRKLQTDGRVATARLALELGMENISDGPGSGVATDA